MNKSRRKVNRFVNGLFEQHGVPRIPVYLHWYNRILVINDNPCFGLFMGNPDNEKEICIHSVAGTKYGTDATMKIIAHEFAHYLQYLYDRDRLDNNIEEMEEEAEAYGQELVQKFIDKKMRGEERRMMYLFKKWRCKYCKYFFCASRNQRKGYCINIFGKHLCPVLGKDRCGGFAKKEFL